MRIYVVSKICDYEYFCTEVVFVTSDEDIAKQYCEENSVKERCWDGNVRDTITYQEYKLEN